MRLTSQPRGRVGVRPSAAIWLADVGMDGRPPAPVSAVLDAARPGVDRLPALTGIRLPLALWVVVHHLSGPGRPFAVLVEPVAPLAAFIDAAWVALTAFFAMSGFLLTRRYADTRWTRPALRHYAAARLARIYPLYALSLLILLPIMAEGLASAALGAPIDRLGIALNYLLLLQGWHRPAVDWNTPAWSLSCEIFFYACAPLVVGLMRRPSRARLLATVAGACAVPIVLRFLVAPPIPKALLYAGDFLVGVAAAGIFTRLEHARVDLARVAAWLSWPVLGVGTWWVIWGHALVPFLVFDTGLRLLGMALVLGLACGGGSLVRLLSAPAAQRGGRASYAIYILHVPLLWWFERSPLHLQLPAAVGGALYLVLVLAVADYVSRRYEGPADRRLQRWLGAHAGADVSRGPTVSRIEAARCRSAGARAEPLRHASARVLPGPGGANGRTTS